MPQDATLEKPVWAKMWQNDQSHERLAKHAPTNMYMTTKWEAINHLITTLGLIVILHNTLYTFIYINAPISSIYLFKFVCSICVKEICVACICLLLMPSRNSSWKSFYRIIIWLTEPLNNQVSSSQSLDKSQGIYIFPECLWWNSFR